MQTRPDPGEDWQTPVPLDATLDVPWAEQRCMALARTAMQRPLTPGEAALLHRLIARLARQARPMAALDAAQAQDGQKEGKASNHSAA